MAWCGFIFKKGAHFPLMIVIGESLFDEALLKFMVEDMQIFFELNWVFDTSRLQIMIDILVSKLF